MGPGPWDPGPREPGIRDSSQSLKVGPGAPRKFKSGTPGPPSKFQSGTPGPPLKFKSGTPSMKSFFFQNIFSFFLLTYFCVFFK